MRIRDLVHNPGSRRKKSDPGSATLINNINEKYPASWTNTKVKIILHLEQKISKDFPTSWEKRKQKIPSSGAKYR
jgi:hypothetical protein